MYCLALRTAARYSGRRKLEVTFNGPCFFAFDGFFGRSAATGSSRSRRGSFILRPCGASGLIEERASLLNFAHGGIVFRAEAAGAFGKNIADDPQAVLHM